jgi:preprotein translocase subunit YajC
MMPSSLNYDVGGTHRFDIGQRVRWVGGGGLTGRIIALTAEPSVTIEFDHGARLTVGQSVVVLEADDD